RIRTDAVVGRSGDCCRARSPATGGLAYMLQSASPALRLDGVAAAENRLSSNKVFFWNRDEIASLNQEADVRETNSVTELSHRHDTHANIQEKAIRLTQTLMFIRSQRVDTL